MEQQEREPTLRMVQRQHQPTSRESCPEERALGYGSGWTTLCLLVEMEAVPTVACFS
jgi:hypothetical protein